MSAIQAIGGHLQGSQSDQTGGKMPRKKGSNQQKAADRLFTQGQSVRQVAKKLRISSSWAGSLRERWHDSMSPAPVAPPPLPHLGRATPAPPGPAQSTDQEVLALLADPKVKRDIEAMLTWARKDNLSKITFEEIYRWTREIRPNTEQRNRLFAVWSDTQTYSKLMRDNQGLEPENALAAEDSPTPAEPEAPIEVMKVATEEEISQAQRWAEAVLHRYDVFRLHSDHGNLIEIARNAESLFSKEQVEQAQAFVANPLLGRRPGE